jgi:PAS domain S-box-containing protein
VLQLKAEIADRERAQEAFRESQARLLEAHRLAHIGIWSWTPETDAVVWSEELYKIAGIDPHQPAPSYAEHPKLYTPESWQLLAAAVDKALRTAEPYKLELELIRPDGSRRWINAYGGAKRDSSGRIVGLHGTVQDVTETRRSEEARRTLEEKLRVSQKMEAIGSLAGGVAHDFNNVLNIIFGYAQLSLQRLNQNDPLYENIQQIIGAGDRAAGLTRQLLAFSRKQVLQPIVLNLNQIIGEFEMMLRRILGEDIDFILVLAPDLGVVRADPSQIEQVLLNLVVNARDAMSEGGKLTVETSNVEIDQEYAAHHVDTKPGPYVQLAISDTGCGMDDKTRARIFEPFFTTKSNGKGTGLGLSTVYGIVTQSGGNVSVYSEPGRGTTFKIYLPRELSVEATAVGVPTVVSPSTGTETILVVEDESALRKIAKLSLETAGFTVLTAADGDEALQISSRHAGDIQLLLTDVVMPRMTGRGIAQALAKTRPAIKVLYMSGYADAAIVHDGVLDEGTHFISKPFTLTALTRKVREALDGY